MAHASSWYERAIPGLSGLKKMKAEKRIANPNANAPKSSDAGDSKTSASKSSTAESGAKPTATGTSALPQLMQRIKEQVKSAQLVKTAEVGFNAGSAEYSGVPEAGGLLVGFELSHDGSSFTAIQPIFLTEKGQVNGPIYGNPNGDTVRVLAKKGYAVAAMNVGDGLGIGGFGINGLAIGFMEIGVNGLNPDKSYETDWIGAAVAQESRQIGRQWLSDRRHFWPCWQYGRSAPLAW